MFTKQYHSSLCLSRDFLYAMHIIYSSIVCVMNFYSRIIADSLSILSINKAVCEWFCFNLPVCSGCLTGAPQKARRRAVIPAGVRRGGSACGDGRSHRKSGLAPIDRGQAAQIIYKVVYELLGCMKGLQPFHMKSAAATCAARGAEACRCQWRMQAGRAPGIARSAIRATMRVPRKAASRFRYHLECARRAREK